MCNISYQVADILAASLAYYCEHTNEVECSIPFPCPRFTQYGDAIRCLDVEKEDWLRLAEKITNDLNSCPNNSN